MTERTEQARTATAEQWSRSDPFSFNDLPMNIYLYIDRLHRDSTVLEFLDADVRTSPDCRSTRDDPGHGESHELLGCAAVNVYRRPKSRRRLPKILEAKASDVLDYVLWHNPERVLTRLP